MFLVLDIKPREGLMGDRYAFVIDLKPSVQKLCDVQCTEIVLIKYSLWVYALLSSS